tara:strand:- start:73 stop:597 length:525 start_codon:yes stop_codon:yes gene_type:complete
MSSEPKIEAQKLVTQSIVQLMEFDFRAIGGTARVFLANELEGDGGSGKQILDLQGWDGQSDSTNRQFQYIDFTLSNLRSDLTGQVSEPTISIAAHDLWQISGWSSATSGFGMVDYRGLRVKRMRLFYETDTPIDPQTYFVKSVDELSPEQIVFTLTPSLGTENGNKPSARKLEI